MSSGFFKDSCYIFLKFCIWFWYPPPSHTSTLSHPLFCKKKKIMVTQMTSLQMTTCNAFLFFFFYNLFNLLLCTTAEFGWYSFNRCWVSPSCKKIMLESCHMVYCYGRTSVGVTTVVSGCPNIKKFLLRSGRLANVQSVKQAQSSPTCVWTFRPRGYKCIPPSFFTV